MSELFLLQILTPKEEFYHGYVVMVEMATTEGRLGIYRNHVPLTAAVAPGSVRIHEDDRVLSGSLSSGFVEILPDRVTVMADRAVWTD